MAKSVLGCKIFTCFVAFVMAISLNVPTVAFALGETGDANTTAIADDETDGANTAPGQTQPENATAEQPQSENVSGGVSEQSVSSGSDSSGVSNSESSIYLIHQSGARVGYNSIFDAFKNAESGDTIQLNADVETTSNLEVKDKTLTLNLHGYELSLNPAHFTDSVFKVTVGKGGNLTVKDDTANVPDVDGPTLEEPLKEDYDSWLVSGYSGGKISNHKYVDNDQEAVSVSDGGSFTLDSGEIDGYRGVAVYGNANADSASDYSTASIEGGYILGQINALGVYDDGSAVRVNGGVLQAEDGPVVYSCHSGSDTASKSNKSTIDISDGTIVAHHIADDPEDDYEASTNYLSCGIFHALDARLNISGGIIFVQRGAGVFVANGNADITGGCVETTGRSHGAIGSKVKNFNNAVSDLACDCSAVSVDGNSNAGHDFGVTISGSADIKTHISQDSRPSAINRYSDDDTDGKAGTLVATGGTYSTDVSDYVPADYTVTKIADDSYSVGRISFNLADYPIDAEKGTRKAVDYETLFGKVNKDVAFAGWYQDAALTKPYDSSATEGIAYPKFVPVSDLITFRGFALRMDGPDPTISASLRFGYYVAVPDGAKYVSNGWDYFTDYTFKQRHLDAYNNLVLADGRQMSNLVFPNISKNGYLTSVYSTMLLSYTTADGTAVEAKQSGSINGNVLGVAKKIIDSSTASAEEKAYAQKIVDLYSTSSEAEGN